MNYFIDIDGTIMLAEQRGDDTWILFDALSQAHGRLYVEPAEYDSTSAYVMAETRDGETVACIAYLDLRGGIEHAARELVRAAD